MCKKFGKEVVTNIFKMEHKIITQEKLEEILNTGYVKHVEIYISRSRYPYHDKKVYMISVNGMLMKVYMIYEDLEGVTNLERRIWQTERHHNDDPETLKLLKQEKLRLKRLYEKRRTELKDEEEKINKKLQGIYLWY